MMDQRKTNFAFGNEFQNDGSKSINNNSTGKFRTIENGYRTVTAGMNPFDIKRKSA